MGSDELDATLLRLEDQIAWYDAKSATNQRWHRRAAVAQLGCSVAIPVIAWLTTPLWPAILGAAVAIVTGLNTLFQWEFNWINYRATCEKLKHEKHLFEAKAGPYADAPNAQRLLAERIEATVSREHASWITIFDRKQRGGCLGDA